jgi:hypothetical protein
MMAPRYERLRVLHEALDCAGRHLDDPIHRIEVKEDQVLFWAGAQTFAVRYEYRNAYDRRGAAMPGSGRWQVTPGLVRGRPSFRALLRRLLSRGRPPA